MQLLFNVKQKNVIAQVENDYFYMGKKIKKLTFKNEKAKEKAIKFFKPLKPTTEEHSVTDESLSLEQWKDFPVWLENQSNGAEGNLDNVKFHYDNITVYINGGCFCGNTQEYVLSGIIELFKQSLENADNQEH